VIGRTGQLALVWPAYWSGRISGNGAMTPLVSVEAVSVEAVAVEAVAVEAVAVEAVAVEAVAVAALGFFGALLLALAYTRTARAGPEPLRGEPKRRANEPNRRDHSRTAPVRPSAQTWPPRTQR